MQTTAFQRFIEYAELDQKNDRLQQERSSLTRKIEQITQQKDVLLEGNRVLCKNAHSLRKELDLLELELKTLGEKLTRTQKLLNEAPSVKEYTALQHEVESLKDRRSLLEESGLALLTRWEEAQKICDQLMVQEPSQVKEFDNELSVLLKRVEEVDALKAAYSSQLKKDQQDLDTELLSQYISMKERVPNPVVPLINGQCTACFFSANTKDVAEIMHGGLVRCKNCYRFLYTHQPVKKNDL